MLYGWLPSFIIIFWNFVSILFHHIYVQCYWRILCTQCFCSGFQHGLIILYSISTHILLRNIHVFNSWIIGFFLAPSGKYFMFYIQLGLVMVFNATFSNISVYYIMAVSIIFGGNQSTGRKPPTCRAHEPFLLSLITLWTVFQLFNHTWSYLIKNTVLNIKQGAVVIVIVW
jgi:hypothetical protein